MKSVLIAFADNTLGGTSRSSLSWGQAFSKAGWDVSFRPLRGIHEDRRVAFERVGSIVSPEADLRGKDAPLIAFHHGAWSKRMLRELHEFGLWANAQWPVGLRVVSNNVFAVPDGPLERAFPGADRTTAVLGAWAAAQYASSSVGTGMSRLQIVPNPQDSGFFRVPTISERQAARRRFDLPHSSRVVLRIGSPHDGKWSNSYVALVEALDSATFLFVGAPPALREAIGAAKSVRYLEATGDDDFIRDLYWSADVFAHDARRGETFGNVLTEALLCGLPAVYRSREFRDNTPWEFQRLPGFHYRRGAKAWITALREVDRSESSRTTGIDFAGYTIDAVAERIRRTGEIGTSDVHDIGLVNRLRVLVLHNPLTALIKRLRINSARG